MLAARDLGRLTGYSLLVSAGTLLGVFVFADAPVLAGGLFYMVLSTLGAASLYLLSGLIGVNGDDQFEDSPMLEPYSPDTNWVTMEEDERPVLIPAPIGILSAAFLISALLIAGIPPLPGFLAKLAILGPLLQNPPGPYPAAASVMAALVIASSFFSLVAFLRAGIHLWWADTSRIPPSIRATEMAPVSAILLACLILTPVVEGPFGFIRRTANQLLDARQYVETVLGKEASH
jgi:multicomponent K+:H+ antiporter subunit D